MGTKTIVGIKKLWYAEPIKSSLTGTDVFNLTKDGGSAKEISNVHGSTWVYEEAEPSTTDYINQLTGKVYYRDSVPGAVQISFSIGQYDYLTKEALQGGKTGDSGKSWSRDDSNELIYKAIIAQTKDNTFIVFPNAAITARGGMVEDKVLGLLMTAVAMETGNAGVPSEKWFDSEVVKQA